MREKRVGSKGDEKGEGSGLILTYNPTSFDLGDLSNSRSHSSSCPIYHQGLPLLRMAQLQVGCRTEGEAVNIVFMGATTHQTFVTYNKKIWDLSQIV